MREDLFLKDFLDRDSLKQIQLQRLRETLERVYANVPFYKAAFDEAGVKPADLETLEDLSKFPFTVKTDLRDNYPFGMFSADMSEVVRIHASSGTTGKPTVVGYTTNDISIWSEVMVRTFQCIGIGPGDVVQNAYGYGLFTGGLGAHYGLERLGCTVIPMSGGNTEKQLVVMNDFGTTAICCTPSYFLYLVEQAEKAGKPIQETKLKKGIFGAEPWSTEMRQRIEADTGVKAFDIYGLSEVIGPGVSSECEAQSGLHIFEDHFYPEIIDPDTGDPKAPGERGELVFTMITKEALPLIRYRTRDITALHYDKCACGRTIVRMDRVSHRSDDMLIVRGVNLFPSQVEEILLEAEGTTPHYLLVLTRTGELDDLEVRVEVTAETFSDEVRVLEALQNGIRERMKSLIGLSAKVTLVEPGTIERSVGKAKRVLDLRN
ncbi:MAG: phenylacetate--CoA ligase [Lentisphaerae bacterium]|jgi:phenylacetate-CoA ligase|nr:phenylacetate--CoA ligase [Lentisphaerota bacterium]MBT4821426.1 phenylacetate--CoA ligase [Lentisphaerota bacterium]MBT5612615.1 phenylacetate--CoA ligase [Lentisphaerota bacterium]MBT7059274.1 phenylacetate--CoA ligase [Lentisphaerota bacterium]MBT7845795.1 phenylacetate--CoA ligase [Lentisphaerota bacterium]